MRFAVLGAGMQGVACAYDLLCGPQTESVLLLDADRNAVEAASARILSDKLQVRCLDCSRPELLGPALSGVKVAISALPYRFNLQAARAALEAGVSFIDMGGNTDLVLEELKLSDVARRRGLCLIPDCGLAPGLVNVLVADAVNELEGVDKVEIRVGGIPERPVPPWNYRLVFSFYGLINEYTGKAAVLRDYRLAEEPVLEGLEEMEFPEPVGKCEAAFTSGGSSTLPWTYAGRIRELDYKTIRYPGHYHLLQGLAALGLFSREPVTVEGQQVIPLEVLRELFMRHLGPSADPDLIVLRVTSRGQKGGRQVKLVHQLIDRMDGQTGFSAMERCTAFPTSIIAQMIARGDIDKKGAFAPEQVVPPARLLEELSWRNITIERRLD
jgi:lysine 6-dehydrogenase